MRKEHEQIIDHINIDTVTKSEWDSFSVDKAKETVKDFSEYLNKHKDEIKALSIFYNQLYNSRNITFKMIKMDWLRMIKDHVVSSYHIEIEDLDYTPFDAQGGRGKM